MNRVSYILLVFVFLLPPSSGATTVGEVARELECPCECPLILEDCNMSCGLSWKDEIGEQIKAGKTKEEIIEAFVRKYGEGARVTPYKRLKGKIYQYTRGFDTLDWTMVWAASAAWIISIVFGIFLVIRRFSGKRG